MSIGATKSTSPAGPGGSDPHRLEAVRDAQSILEAYVPPTGATRLVLPTGRLLTKPPSYPATPNLIDLHRYWRTNRSMAAVITWARRHAGAHWSIAVTGVSGRAARDRAVRPPGLGRLGVVEMTYIGFTLPTGTQFIQSSQVFVSAVPAGAGHSNLRLDVQNVWIPSRPAWSMVSPLATRITATLWSTSQPHRAASSNPAVVAAFRRAVDAMQVSTSGVTSCPAYFGQRFELRFSGGRSRPLSVAGDTAECGGVTLVVKGHPPLRMADVSGRVLATVRMLLHAGAAVSRHGSAAAPITAVAIPPIGTAVASRDAGTALVEGVTWWCTTLRCPPHRPTSARLLDGGRLLATSPIYRARARGAGPGTWYLFRFYVKEVPALQFPLRFGPPQSSAWLTVEMNNGWHERIAVAPGASYTASIEPGRS